MVNTFSFLSFPFLSIAISYMLKPMIDIFKLICYRAWITLEGNQMPLGMCHSRVFDLLYELVMIKVTACHPSKKKCKHSMKRTIPIRILLAYLMIISNPFEGTISFENSKCLHVFVSHWLTQMKNERERERDTFYARKATLERRANIFIIFKWTIQHRHWTKLFLLLICPLLLWSISCPFNNNNKKPLKNNSHSLR